MANELLIATGNLGKLREFTELLQPVFSILSPADLGKPAPEVEEDGETYYENALKKALRYYQVFQTAVLSDDSGLEVDALAGAPGVRSARFGGEAISWPERWSALYRALESFPLDQWSARFRCVLCFYRGPGSVPAFFEGTVEGRILPEAQGRKGFGYDPIFFASALGVSFGEADPAAKQRVSHRAAATRTFLLEHASRS